MLTKRQRLEKHAKRIRLRLRNRKAGRADVVFVLGEMRSGTNMLAQALERHERVECFHENDDEAFEDYVLRPHDTLASLVRQSYADKVVFKSIADMGRAGDLLHAFPGSLAIFIYRHFEDVVNSALRNFSQHRDYLRLVVEDDGAAGWRRWGLSSHLVDLIHEYHMREISDASARALIWYTRNRAFLERGLIESGKSAVLNYESLVQDPHAHFRMAADFIGLDYSDRMQAGVVATSVRRSTPPEIDARIHELCTNLYERMQALASKQHSLSHQPVGLSLQ